MADRIDILKQCDGLKQTSDSQFLHCIAGSVSRIESWESGGGTAYDRYLSDSEIDRLHSLGRSGHEQLVRIVGFDKVMKNTSFHTV